MTGKPLVNVAVIGMGTQGPMIAFRAAACGKQVAIYDILPAKSAEAVQKMPAWLDAWVAKGRLTEDGSYWSSRGPVNGM